MLVAPTEPPAFSVLGRRVLYPERLGCDFAFCVRRAGRALWHGVQRKELKDFVASVNDGRLAMEVKQMAGLTRAMLVIEGTPRWSLDGELVLGGFSARWTYDQHLAYLYTMRDAGVWVEWSKDVAGTIDVIRAFEQWARKDRHRAFDSRPGPSSPWGTLTNRDYQRHLVMGLPGVGAELADRIIDTLGMPFGLRVSEVDLLSVEGIGAKKARTIVAALETIDREVGE